MDEGIESLKSEIISKAKDDASSIIKEANQEAAKIIKEAESKIESRRRESEEEAKFLIEASKKKALINAEIEAKRMELEAKKSLIEEVFEKAKERIGGIDNSKRNSITNSLYKKACNEIDIGKVYCNKKDSKMFKGVETSSTDIIGGLIAESKDGLIRVDYSFDTMLESIKENEIKGVVDALFKNEELKI